MSDPNFPPPPPQQPYGYAPMMIPPPHPQASLILILGIVSIVACSLTGPFAWILGNKARAEIRNNPGQYSEDGTLKVGWILGIIGSVIFLGALLLFVFLFGLAFLADV